ncbi:hypothetical protein GCM10027088_30310 [Nocardia goodfellowii]
MLAQRGGHSFGLLLPDRRQLRIGGAGGVDDAERLGMADEYQLHTTTLPQADKQNRPGSGDTGRSSGSGED